MNPCVVFDAGDGTALDPDPRHRALLDDVDAAARRRRAHSPTRRRRGARCRRAAARGRQESGSAHPAQQSRFGIQRAISSRVRNFASMPLRRIALPRRIAASRSAGEWTRFSTPRALYITLKLRSCDKLLPQLERELVEVRVGIEVIVRAHDRRVAPGVAAAEPAFLEHGDVARSRAPWPDSRRSRDRARRRRRRSRRSAASARDCATRAASARGSSARCAPARRSNTSTKASLRVRGRVVLMLSLADGIAYSNGPERCAGWEQQAHPLRWPDWRKACRSQS